MKLKTALLLLLISYGYSFGNPQNGTVVSGTAEIKTSGSTLTVLQTSDRAIIDWKGGFSIGQGEKTEFFQPSVSSAVLNRDISGALSKILGNLSANGKVYLMNPNGIIVGPSGVVNTGGFLATTLDQWTSDFFENGELGLKGDSDAAIINLGEITATGDIFLIARKIENTGVIKSTEGFVGLAAGNDVLLKESGQERIFIRPEGEGEIDITGTIEAINIEIKSRGNPYSMAINLEGQLTANKVDEVGGRVFLQADTGDINIAEIIDADDVTITSIGGNVISDVNLSPVDHLLADNSEGASISIDSGNLTLSGFDSFNISEGGTVAYFQPVSSVSILNRVTSGTPSQISGRLLYNVSNGSIYFINPNGITVGSGNDISISDGSSVGSVGNLYLSNPIGVSSIQPIIFRPVILQPTSEYLNSTLFSNIKSGKSVTQHPHSSILEDTVSDTLLARFSTQAEDDGKSIINLNR